MEMKQTNPAIATDLPFPRQYGTELLVLARGHGSWLQDIAGKKGYPVGKEIMEKATEGKILEVTYWWPRPGSDTPLEKHTFYTKVDDQNCGVGFYKD